MSLFYKGVGEDITVSRTDSFLVFFTLLVVKTKRIKIIGIATFMYISGDNSIKNTIFWDIAPCNPLSVNRRFGGTYGFHLQGRKIS
jgi:hypothetical protein